MQQKNTEQQLLQKQWERALKLLKEGKLGQETLTEEDLIEIAEEFD